MKIRAIEDRRSIRRFMETPVPQEMLEQTLEAARRAPSTENNQPWEFHVWGPEMRKTALAAMEEALRCRMERAAEAEERRMLAGAVHTLRVMKQAPVLVAVVRPGGTHPFSGIEGTKRVRELLDVMSVGAAVENLLLEACGLGLGTLWIGNTFLTYDALCGSTGVQGQLLGVVAMGYADETPAERPRKALETTVKYTP